MSEASCESQLWLCLNHWKLEDRAKVEAHMRKLKADQEKKRAAKEAAFNALVEKRMKI